MERKALFFNAKVKPIKPINDEFTLCRVSVCALDKNRNLSNISKDSAEDAQPTLYNVPVVGHLYVDDDGNYRMGGHDMALEKDKDGFLRFRSLCVPYGVIPQQDNVHYEDLEEPNGDTKTYICCDAILWTGRFPELKKAIYSEDCWFGQSMEINVLEHEPLEEDKNYTNILKYSYSALCLLGKSDNPEFHTEPCFPVSQIEPYEFAYDAEFTELMTALKEELSSCFANNGKGGEGMKENETVITDQPSVVEDFEEKKFEGDVAEPEVIDAPEETGNAEDVSGTADNFTADVDADVEPEPVVEVTPEAFSSTYREKRQAIENALPDVVEGDDEGMVVHTVHYWVCDFDDAHVYVEKYEWLRDSGDTSTKGRFGYEFNEADKTAAISGDFEEMFVRWLTKEEVDALEDMRAQYAELVEYKNNKLREEHELEIDSALKEFANLAGNEEFEQVVKDRYSFESVEAIKDACYLIRGKYSIPVVQHQPSAANEPAVPIKNDSAIPESIYDRFHKRFSKN